MRLMMLGALVVLTVACGAQGSSPTGITPPEKCASNPALLASDPACVPAPPVDFRPVVTTLFLGAKGYAAGSSTLKWVVTPLTGTYTLVKSYLPCVTKVFLPFQVAGVLVAGDTVAIPNGNLEWTSSDTTVISFTRIVSGGDVYTAHYKRAGETRVTALYRDGMSVGRVVTVAPPLNAGPGTCVGGEG
ncbi:MAG: hypothetical protein C0497_07340 [Gemmatimonas sp.]|nr:hypothetical protein [Gemmatimonas sp.]